MNLKLVLIAILLLSSLRLSIPYLGQGIWWDEAVYLGLANGIRAGYYSLDPSEAIESFRPPLVPMILATLPAFVAPVFFIGFSLVAIYVVYLLGRTFNERAGLLAALFTATLPLFVIQGSKFMTEPLFMVWTAFSLLFLEKRSEKTLIVSGVFLGLAFLTRYVALIVLLGIGIFFIVERKRYRFRSVALFFLTFFVVISPWMLLSQLNYGSPFAAAFVNARVYSVSITQTFGDGVWLLFTSLTFLLPLVALSFWRKSFSDALPLLCVLVLTLFLSGPHKEDRYLLSFLPLFAVLAAEGAEILILHWSRIRLPLICTLVFLSMLSFGIGFRAAIDDVQYDALVNAIHYIQTENPSSRVLTQSYPFAYAEGLVGVPYCPWPQDALDACQGEILSSGSATSQLERALARSNVDYILSYAYEPANPKDARDYLNNHFQKIKTFAQWGNDEAVVVYAVS